jgi:signal transduction histidine kinase
MSKQKNNIKIALIVSLVGSILCLHYFTIPGKIYHHALYRVLFYLPLILGSFWFGLKGALYISAAVFVSYLPFAIIHWQGLSFDDFGTLVEGGLYIVIALVLGLLVEKERRNHKILVGAERLAAIGKAVTEVAHDMKTPLSAIGGFTSQILRKLGKNDPNRAKLEIVIEETARLETMVKGMLDFGKPMELQITQANLNQLILETLELSSTTATKNGVGIETDLDSSLPLIAGDPFKIKEMLLNLVTNAIQASPRGEHVIIKSGLNEKGTLVEVTDHGEGITEENRESVFHPFFSIKKGGTGLGLGIVKKIVDAHRGEVSFRPNPQKGLTFTVLIPNGRTNIRKAMDDKKAFSMLEATAENQN